MSEANGSAVAKDAWLESDAKCPVGRRPAVSPVGEGKTRECLDRRDRTGIYGTEYARVKRINGKSCCPLNLPRAFRPLLLRTMKREGLSIGDAGKFFAPDAGGCGIRTAYGCRKGDNSLRKGGGGGAVWDRVGAVPEPVILFPDGFGRRGVPHWEALAVRQECGMTVSQGKNRSRGKAALPRRRCIHSTGMLPRSRYRLRPCG